MRPRFQRFAQSAGPGFRSSKFCTVPHIFLPKMFKKQDGMQAFFGALFESFFHLRGHFLSNFRPLEALWGSYGLIFGVKKWLGAPNMPQDCPKRRHPRFAVTFLKTLWSIFFVCFVFPSKKSGYEICNFFLRFLGRPERSTGWAHMQSVHAGAVQTHFFSFTFFLKIAS